MASSSSSSSSPMDSMKTGLLTLISQCVGNNNSTTKMDDPGQKLLLEYTQELTKTILEHAIVIAKFKDANKIDASDIALILEKKLDIVVPGQEKHQFYKSVYRLQERRGIKRKVGM